MYGLLGRDTIFGQYITIWKSGVWGWKKKSNIEKIAFKVVQMKFLAMHITNQKLSFYIFTEGNFWHKRKIIILNTKLVLLAIATNIPVLLMTGFVVQGHI